MGVGPKEVVSNVEKLQSELPKLEQREELDILKGKEEGYRGRIASCYLVGLPFRATLETEGTQPNDLIYA